MFQIIVHGTPISTNAAYRKGRAGRGLFMTEEAKAWKKQIALEAQNMTIERRWTDEQYTAPFLVELEIYRPANRGDVNNFDKLVLDALQGIAYDNDSQVQSLLLTKFVDKANPRIVIYLKPLL